jgi:hypothetical protein
MDLIIVMVKRLPPEIPMPAIRPLARVTGHLCGAVFSVWAAAALAQTSVPAQTQPQASTSSAPAVVSTRADKPAPRTGRRAPLDLHAPPLSHIYSSTELRYILAPDDSTEDSATEVSVKGTKYVSPVPGAPGNQLLAIPWALMHPTQAWRIFTPLEEP